MRLKRHLGQHLLVARGVIARIAQLIEPKEDEILVEIGPGTGNLTKEILKYSFRELHLLEIDRSMIESLEKEIRDKRVKIHLADATSFDFCSLGESIKIFGNLPYNVASLILENIVFHHRCIPQAVCMVQKEVAEKIQKGSSWLSMFVRTFYSVEYLMSIPGRFFLPPPKVQSGLVRLKRIHNPPQLNLEDYKSFLVGLYSMKRKALKNKLQEDLLKSVGINPMERVETLDPERVLLLYNMRQKLRGEQK